MKKRDFQEFIEYISEYKDKTVYNFWLMSRSKMGISLDKDRSGLSESDAQDRVIDFLVKRYIFRSFLVIM